jgi:hypothetical protein
MCERCGKVYLKKQFYVRFNANETFESSPLAIHPRWPDIAASTPESVPTNALTPTAKRRLPAVLL